jgi:hypothetical protein
VLEPALKRSIGTKCSAPYIGSVHQKTVKKPSIGENVQLATSRCGCKAAHGPYGGYVTRQTSRAVMFARWRSLGSRWVSRGGHEMVRGHTGRAMICLKSARSKVCVRTMSRVSRLIETASFGSCPAVLSYASETTKRRTSRLLQRAGLLVTHQAVYEDWTHN